MPSAITFPGRDVLGKGSDCVFQAGVVRVACRNFRRVRHTHQARDTLVTYDCVRGAGLLFHSRRSMVETIVETMAKTVAETVAPNDPNLCLHDGWMLTSAYAVGHTQRRYLA